MLINIIRIKNWLIISIIKVLKQMKGFQTHLSGKDLQLMKVTFRAIVEDYYESPNEDTIADVIHLNDLIMQNISTKSQSDSLLITSLLQILKLKSKSNQELSNSVQQTIIHLKNPMKIYIKDSTLQECLDRASIFPLCCTLICRTFEPELKPHANDYNWKDILTKIGKNADKDMNISLETLGTLLPNFSQLSKQINKSGLIKILFSVYLVQNLSDKNNLYKALKVLKIVSSADRTVLINRQKNLSTVIETHQQYTQIARQISQNCFDSDYCSRMVANVKDIDGIFLWSFNSTFCQLATQNTINQLEAILQKEGSGINKSVQFKIYSSINNFIKSKDGLYVKQSWKMPVHQENLNPFLKLAISCIERNEKNYQKIDLKKIQHIYEKSKNTDPITDKLLQQLRNLDPQSKHKRVGHLKSSTVSAFEIQKNAEMLMEKAMKIPKNNNDALFIKELLNQKPHETDEFQIQTFNTIRSKALDSLKIAIAQNRPINLADIFNNINLASITPAELNKIYKIMELHLTINPDLADGFNKNKLIETTQWLEDNHGLEVIDWVAIGQVLQYVFGPDQWKNHIKDIPKQNFWLLNAYDCEVTDELIKKLNSINLENDKLPIIVGFIGKTNNAGLMKKLFQKTQLVKKVTENIKNYNSNPHMSVQPYMSLSSADFPPQALEMKNYLNNVLNASHFIYNWPKGEMKKEIEQKIIKPSLPSIYKNFHGSQPQFRFLQNSLPFKLDIKELKDMNVIRLMERHGNLSSYLYRNKYDGKIDLSKIASLGQHLQNFEGLKVEEILKFLENNEGMIESQDLNNLLNSLIRNAKRDHKYWKLFPNYMSILNHILSIAGKTQDPQIISLLPEMIQRAIQGTLNNDDITPEELEEMYENIYKILGQLVKNKIKIDTKLLMADIGKIQSQEWRQKLMDILNQMDAIKVQKKQQKTMPLKVPQSNKILLQEQSATIKQVKANRYENTPSKSMNSSVQNQANMSTLKMKVDNQQEKKGQNFDNQLQIDPEQMMKDEEKGKPINQQEKELMDALMILRQIIKKQKPKDLFPGLVHIFLRSQFSKKKKYILGHSLTEYYEIIQKNQSVIDLLKMRDKTNLSKTECYKFLNKFQEVFIIAKRWKLLGQEFIDLAIKRIQTTNKDLKTVCIENSCQVLEYNMLKTADLNYFQKNRYHLIVAKTLQRITEINELVYYLLLIGTSSRLTQIKVAYIGQKIHLKLLDFLKRPSWNQNKHVVANISYALSSLVYTQNHIAVDVVSKKQQIQILFDAYEKHFYDSKIVVQSGCSLISNLCYSNKECKEILFKYGIHSILCNFMFKNLQKPEVSTYKQIMRAMGNLSLHKPCVEKFIDFKVSAGIVEMISKFDILFYRDQERLKVLKLTIDFVSNMASQKYRQMNMHEEGVTDLVITLLETTEISQDHIMMGCIDTIDGLCQDEVIQNYCVMDKKLPYLLIDLLKVKEDQKLITKSIRLLTNMTISQTCIPYILQANLLSVLANIVLPMYHNPKIEVYVNKIIHRIFNQRPPIKQIIKCGYLDCLLKTADNSANNVEDSFIDIVLHYSQHFPAYLSNRTFQALTTFMIVKENNKHCIDKTLKVMRIMYTSQQKDGDDFYIEGMLETYERLYNKMEDYRVQLIFLIAIHSIKCKKFKSNLITQHQNKKSQIINHIHTLSLQDNHRDFAHAAMFAVLNHNRQLFPSPALKGGKEEQQAMKVLKKGCKCKLFRADGSSKQAIIDINQQNMIRAYKYPDGQIKKKYTMSIRQIRDWQFVINPGDDTWRQSVFSMNKGGLFETQCQPKNCVILLGSRQWGQFSFICVEFESLETKNIFVGAISVMLMCFKR